MPTPTANYSFQLPTPGGDDDVWGDLLNANWTALDAQLFSGTIGASTTGNAATATLAVDATTLETARDFTIGATTRSFDGSADVAWSLPDIGVVLADQAEAQAGTDNAKFMTPLRTAEAIAALTPPVATLTQTQAEDPTSTVFGTVSGQRLAQSDAGRGYGEIGTYAYLMFRGDIITEGQVVSGSSLSPAGHATTGDNPPADDPSVSRMARGSSTMLGSWRVMGRVAVYPGSVQGSNTGRVTLFLRVQ